MPPETSHASTQALRGYSRRPPVSRPGAAPLPPRMLTTVETLERAALAPIREHMQRPQLREDFAQHFANFVDAVRRGAYREHSGVFATSVGQLTEAMGYPAGAEMPGMIYRCARLAESIRFCRLEGQKDEHGRDRFTIVTLLDPDVGWTGRRSSSVGRATLVRRRPESRSESAGNHRRPWCRKSGRGDVVPLFFYDPKWRPIEPWGRSAPKGATAPQGSHVVRKRARPGPPHNGFDSARKSSAPPPRPVAARQRQGSQDSDGAVLQGPWEQQTSGTAPSSQPQGPVGNDGAVLLLWLDDDFGNPWRIPRRNGDGQSEGLDEPAECGVPARLCEWFPFRRLEGLTGAESLPLFDQLGGEGAGPAQPMVEQLRRWAQHAPAGTWSVG
jgi:hypothetical protein